MGREAARRAIKDFTEFFGRAWLSQAIEPGPDGAPVWILGRFAPLLALTPARRSALYIESIRWWASIQTLINASVNGLGAVRRLQGSRGAEVPSLEPNEDHRQGRHLRRRHT